GRLWVMGDNRGDSDDSRFHSNDAGGGTVPESAVVGKAFLTIWPLSRVTDFPIPNTFEQAGLSAAGAVATAPPVPLAGGGALAGLTLGAGGRGRGCAPGSGERRCVFGGGGPVLAHRGRTRPIQTLSTLPRPTPPRPTPPRTKRRTTVPRAASTGAAAAS